MNTNWTKVRRTEAKIQVLMYCLPGCGLIKGEASVINWATGVIHAQSKELTGARRTGILSLPLYSLCSGLTGFLSVPLSAPKHPKLISASGPEYVLSLCLQCFLLQPFVSDSFIWFRFQQFSSLPAHPLIANPLLTSAIPCSFSLYESIYSTSHHLNLCMSVCIVCVHKYYLPSFH